MIQRIKNTLLTIVKVCVTVLCLWWLSRYFDAQTINKTVEDFSTTAILAGVLLQVASYFAGAVRWWQLFCFLSQPIPFRNILPTYYLGVFFNNFLPSAYGGDLARTARLYASGMSGKALVNSAIMDRLLGLAAVIAIGGLALLFTDVGQLGKAAWVAVLGGIGLLATAAALMLLPSRIAAKPGKLSSRWPKFQGLFASFSSFRQSPGLMFKGFLLSLLSQLLAVAIFVVLAWKSGVELPVPLLVALLMVVFLVASLPVSLGGLGPREGALMALLLPLGIEASAILSMSIAYIVILWLSALPGLAMLFVPISGPGGEKHKTARRNTGA